MKFYVTCRELVYIDRTYEIEAESPAEAEMLMRKSHGNAGRFVDEQIQDTYSFQGVKSVEEAGE